MKSEERLKFEDCAMKDLRTIYPYGLNDKTKNKITGRDSDTINIGALFPPLPRKSTCFRRERRNRNNRTETLTKEFFFNQVESWITRDVKSSF